MGPRSCERGDFIVELPDVPYEEQLQWGRARASAETALPSVVAPVHSLTLQWGRAHASAETAATGSTRFVMLKLQWGRAHASGETPDL